VTRKIGLAWLTVPELPAPEQVSVAAQAGYTHVGLRLIPVANQVLPAFDERETARRLADTGVKVLDVEVFRLAPETRVAGFEATIAAAARLGATELLVHGARRDRRAGRKRRSNESHRRPRHGLGANLEPMPWVDVSNVAKAKRILDGAERNNSALLVDAIHFFREDNRLPELAALPRKYLRYMQLCDAPGQRPADMQEIIRQARSDRLFPGEGALDLERLMRALPADLAISVETPYAKPMSPLERARRALVATRKVLSCVSQS
jgi:sugar phosphate isomerase/epimerase